MNLSRLTDTELAQLIQQASAELASRLSKPKEERIQDQRPAVVLREPPDDDKEFALQVKSTVSSGGYVSADERERIAALAVDYGPWIKRQGLPTERGTGPWRKLAQRSRIKPARER